MPSVYETTVIANGPVDALWRLDGLVDTHPILLDVSGNGNHATCFDVADHVHGIASPIETDAGSYAMSARVGRWTDTVNRLNTFAWQVWVYTADTNINKVALCRSGEVSLSASNLIWANPHGTGILARLRISGVTYNLSATCVPNTWVYAVLVYNAGVITLYVNAVIGDSTAGVTGDMETGSDTDFYIGAQQSIVVNAFTSAGVDEPAVGPAISAAQVLENYEAALNLLLLNGRSDVIVTSTLRSLITPPPISYPFRHNWAELLIERVAFSTSVSSARTGAEEGNGQRVVPRREFEFVQVLKSHAERRRLRAKLWANQSAIWWVPVRQDGEWLAGSVLAGATTIPVSPQFKDYEIGGYLGIRQLNDSGAITQWEEVAITGLGADITCDPLVNTYTPPALVYPVRRALLDREVSITGHTDSVEELTITARLLPEDEASQPARATVWHPTLQYRDYEVFDLAVWQSNDWSDTRDYEVERQVDELNFDTGLFNVESDTVGASESFSYRMLLKGRADIATFLGWFYARAGQLCYLWVPTMQEDFEMVSAVGVNLTVTDTNYSDNFALAEPRRDLAFVYRDNTMQFRRVVSFSGTVNETLVLDASVPTLTNLRSVSLLKFCRLDADQVELAWVTDDVVQVAWRFRELLHSPEGTGVSSLSPSHSASPSRSPSLSASPSQSSSPSVSPSGSSSPSASTSPSTSGSPSRSTSPSHSTSASTSPSASASPSV